MDHKQLRGRLERRTERNFEFRPPFVRGPLGHFAHMYVKIGIGKAYPRELLLEKMA